MLADIEKFIYKNHVYSKCSNDEKEMIDTCLHGVRQQLETFKDAYRQAQEEIALLKRENKALSDDNEMKCELNEKLNNALDKVCCVIEEDRGNIKDCLDYNRFNSWKEWAMND